MPKKVLMKSTLIVNIFSGESVTYDHHCIRVRTAALENCLKINEEADSQLVTGRSQRLFTDTEDLPQLPLACFLSKASLCSPGCPGSLVKLPASAS